MYSALKNGVLRMPSVLKDSKKAKTIFVVLAFSFTSQKAFPFSQRFIIRFNYI